MDDYRFRLIEIIEEMDSCHNLLFETSLNIIMNGELKEANDVFEVGETFEFNLNILKMSNDYNIKKITKLLKIIDNTKHDIITINNIIEKDVIEYYDRIKKQKN